MADLDKVPGMRKNGAPVPDPEDAMEISADGLLDALNEEVANWKAQGLDPSNLQHDTNSMNMQIMTIVRVMIELELISQDAFNEAFRRTALKELRTQRGLITRAQITAPVQGKGIILP